jgi:Proteobacterial transcriptional regulator-like domain
MPDDESWRSQEATAYLDRAQRIGFAWEFLRRNPDYRDDYDHISRHVASGTTIALEAALALAQRWGLSFPVRPGATERPRTDAMGCQCFASRDGAHDGAARHRKHDALRFFALADILRGSRRRAAHPLAGDSRRTESLDPAGRVASRFGCCRHPVRQAPAATAGRCPSPMATTHGNCNEANHLVPDQATAPPHDFDAEGT